jgi:hypothetical protein
MPTAWADKLRELMRKRRDKRKSRLERATGSDQRSYRAVVRQAATLTR